MKTQQLIIDGMSCGHCVMSVKKELLKVDGLKVENVEIGKAVVQYDESKVNRNTLEKAITEAGYRLVSATN